MAKQKSLHPGDVVVALQLAITPEATLVSIAEHAKRSLGEAHNATKRLHSAGLLVPDSRGIEREPLLHFIRWGVPFAFPPEVGGTTVGVATAVVIRDD